MCVCVLDAPRDIVSSGNMGSVCVSVCMYVGTGHMHTILCPGRGIHDYVYRLQVKVG